MISICFTIISNGSWNHHKWLDCFVLSQDPSFLMRYLCTHLLHGVNNLRQLDVIQVLQSTRPVTIYKEYREELDVPALKKKWRLEREKLNRTACWLITFLYHAGIKLLLVATNVSNVNSRLQEAHELLSLLLGLVGYDGPVGLSFHTPQTHHWLRCKMSEGHLRFLEKRNTFTLRCQVRR